MRSPQYDDGDDEYDGGDEDDGGDEYDGCDEDDGDDRSVGEVGVDEGYKGGYGSIGGGASIVSGYSGKKPNA